MKIKYADKEIELTEDEARELHRALNAKFGPPFYLTKQPETVNHYHYHQLQIPNYVPYNPPYFQPHIICHTHQGIPQNIQ